MVWTNLCRIYRGTLTQKHDLSFLRADEDIYAEDNFCRIAPAENVFVEMPDLGELGLVSTPIKMYFPRGLDIKVGYTVEVKKRVVLEGELSSVETQLSTDAITGASVIYIDDPVNIESGDVAKLVSTDTTPLTQLVNIKKVEGSKITLYADSLLNYDFDAGSDLTICNFYKVFSVLVANGMGPCIEVEGRQIAHVN